MRNADAANEPKVTSAAWSVGYLGIDSALNSLSSFGQYVFLGYALRVFGAEELQKKKKKKEREREHTRRRVSCLFLFFFTFGLLLVSCNRES